MTSENRRKIMQANKPANTRPEIRVRKALHALGYRFRIHRKDLPGKPDVVLPKYKLVIFVHGCFWHQHSGCYLASRPKTREDFWKAKFDANRLRDKKNQIALEEGGWRVEAIWECQTLDPEALTHALRELLAL
ncbi:MULTISPECIES: very short patch repair endonuclease [unclassified Marinobacter]|uniref:very short patch repair endonuclease n=1 Tax=unclassified Marinobacter TaxID=83889 RepID=UPI001267B206|nr:MULTISPECIES: very short patch repair endonuclease [unclassified Marinobacter]